MILQTPIKGVHQLAIDADIVAYSAASASQSQIKWDDELSSPTADFGKAKAIVRNMIKQYQNHTGVKPYVLCLSDRHNFRKDWWPDYKIGRANGERPILLGEVREWMLNEFPSMVIPKLEADDVMSILSTSNPGEFTIVTMDKDLKGTPGKMLHVKRNGEHLSLDISPEEAKRWHYSQVLMGDGADGVPGLKGIGEKTAVKLFEQQGATWSTIVRAYEKHNRTEEEALRNARMLKMLDNTLYVDGEIRKWEPPADELIR
jgi:5'-3' exonuclease